MRDWKDVRANANLDERRVAAHRERLDAAREDAVMVVVAVNRLAEDPRVVRHGNGLRYVPILAVRAATALPTGRFDQAVAYLAAEHKVWLRIDQRSTAEDDAASVRHQGTDYHQISADNWRTT